MNRILVSWVGVVFVLSLVAVFAVDSSGQALEKSGTCSLQSVAWSSTGTIGSPVDFVITGSNCDANDVSVLIKERDTLSSDLALVQPSTFVMVGDKLSGSWVVEPHNDGFGLAGSPEYFIEVKASNTITSSILSLSSSAKPISTQWPRKMDFAVGESQSYTKADGSSRTITLLSYDRVIDRSLITATVRVTSSSKSETATIRVAQGAVPVTINGVQVYGYAWKEADDNGFEDVGRQGSFPLTSGKDVGLAVSDASSTFFPDMDQFAYPVEGVFNDGAFLQTFLDPDGWAHSGYDIGVHDGQRVRAIIDGYVWNQVGSDPSTQGTLWITETNNQWNQDQRCWVFTHIKGGAMLVSQGQFVQKGTPLASVFGSPPSKHYHMGSCNSFDFGSFLLSSEIWNHNNALPAPRHFLTLGPFSGSVNTNVLFSDESNSIPTSFAPKLGTQAAGDVWGYSDAFATGVARMGELLSSAPYSGYSDRDPQNSVGYALTYVYAPTSKTTTLSFGASRGARVWVNGKKVFDTDSTRYNSYDIATQSPLAIDQYTTTATLNAGWNTILIKSDHGSRSGTLWSHLLKIGNSDGSIDPSLIMSTRSINAQVGQVSDTAASIYWSEPSLLDTHISRYLVDVSKDPSFSAPILTAHAIDKTTSFVLSGLQPSTTYYVRIRPDRSEDAIDTTYWQHHDVVSFTATGEPVPDSVPVLQSPPNGLPPQSVPQFVTFGSDDNWMPEAMDWYVNTLFSGRTNPAGSGSGATFDGQPMRMSFYLIGLHETYGRELCERHRQAFDAGHEIGNHGYYGLINDAAHSTVTDWKNLWIVPTNSYLTRPLNCNTNPTGLGIPSSEVFGFRTPQDAFNSNLWPAMQETGFVYHASTATGYGSSFDGSDLYWPGTLEEPFPLPSWAPQTPTAPGFWEIPQNYMKLPASLGGGQVGYCDKDWISAGMTGPEMYDMLVYNFDLHYNGNRAPFHLCLHSQDWGTPAWQNNGVDSAAMTARKKALSDFLDYVASKSDARVVRQIDVINWMRNPAPLGTQVVDTQAPVVTSKSPSGTLSTTTATLKVMTDESALCRFSTLAGQTFSTMNAMAVTGSRQHEHALGSMSAGSYTYYIKCQDFAPTPNTGSDVAISFTVPTASSTGTVVVEKAVASSADDAFHKPTGWPGYSQTLDLVYTGSPGGDNPADPTYAGFRFTGLGIPQGAYITSAYIELAPVESYASGAGTISLQNAASPAAFTSSSTPYTRWNSRTSFSTSYQWPRATSGSVKSADISAGVQELVDRYGVIDTIVVLDSGLGVTGWNSWASFDRSASQAPRLHIEYQGEAPLDTLPPTIIAAKPSGLLAAGTTQTTLNLTTNEAASCRYASSSLSFSSMSPFTTTGTTTHLQQITGLQNGQSYTYFVKCADSAQNIMTTDYQVSFSIASVLNTVGGTTVTVNAGSPVAPFKDTIRGVATNNWNFLWHGLWERDGTCCPPGKLESITAATTYLRPGIIRFAGGLWANTVGWDRNGVAPDDGTWTHSGISYRHAYKPAMVDAYNDLLQATGAEGLVQVNVCDNNLAMWQDMIRYTNIEKNYGFKYWEIGNEQTLESCGLTADTFAQRYKAYRDALRSVDPNIKVMSSAAHQPTFTSWEDIIFNYNKQNLDVLTWHWYQVTEWTSDTTAFAYEGGSVDALLAYDGNVGSTCHEGFGGGGGCSTSGGIADGRLNRWTYRRGIAEQKMDYIKTNYLPTHPTMETAITEFGPHASAHEHPINSNHLAAIWLADVLPRWAYNGLDIVTFYSLEDGGNGPSNTNSRGFIGTWDGSGDIRPIYYTQLLLAQKFGDQMVATSTSDPEQKLTVWATTDSSDPTKLYILLVNLHDSAQSANVAITGKSIVSGSSYLLKSSNPTSLASPASFTDDTTTINDLKIRDLAWGDLTSFHSDVNAILSSGVPITNVGNSFSYSLPAYSAAVLELSTSTTDTQPPQLTSASQTTSGIRLQFSETLSSTAQSTSRYSIHSATDVNYATARTPSSVSLSGTVVDIVPPVALAAGTTYTITVSSIQDLAGNTLSSQSTTITTPQVIDTLAPTLQSMSVSGQSIVLTFSENLAGNATNPANFLLAAPGDSNYATAKQPASVSLSSPSSITLTYSPTFKPQTEYTLLVTDVADLAGNVITPLARSFTTPAASQPVSRVATLPGRFEAENYTDGSNGVSYLDLTSGNAGGAYRSDDVDIEPDSARSSGFNVGWIGAGEWWLYEVSVQEAGDYVFTAEVASNDAGTKAFRIEVDGQDVTGPISFTPTGGWHSWTTVQSPRIALSQGSHSIRVVAETSLFNINYFDAQLIAPEPQDTIPPAFTSVAYDGAVTATFSEAIQVPSASQFTISSTTDANYVSAQAASSVSMVSSSEVSLSLPIALKEGTTYIVTALNIQDEAGNTLSSQSRTFTTPLLTDTTAPTLSSVTLQGTTGIHLVFSEPVDASSRSFYYLTSSTDGGFASPVQPSAVTVDSQTKVTLAVDLNAGHTYTMSVSGVTDLAGNAIVPTTRSITTEAPAPTHPAPVPGAVLLPGKIEAEDYASGTSGTTYYDKTAGNFGGAYRSDDVDIQADSGNGFGYNVGWVEEGEWLLYYVDVAETAEYVFSFNVASAATGTKYFHVEVDGQDVTGPLSVGNTGDWHAWITVNSPKRQITKGVHTIKFVADSSLFNINHFEVKKAADAPTPSPTSITLVGSGYKAKGVHTVDLSWSGATTAVDIYRNQVKIATTQNDGSYTDNTGIKGKARTYSYKVCNAQTATCSPSVDVFVTD